MKTKQYSNNKKKSTYNNKKNTALCYVDICGMYDIFYAAENGNNGSSIKKRAAELINYDVHVEDQYLFVCGIVLRGRKLE